MVAAYFSGLHNCVTRSKWRMDKYGMGLGWLDDELIGGRQSLNTVTCVSVCVCQR